MNFSTLLSVYRIYDDARLEKEILSHYRSAAVARSHLVNAYHRKRRDLFTYWLTSYNFWTRNLYAARCALNDRLGVPRPASRSVPPALELLNPDLREGRETISLNWV